MCLMIFSLLSPLFPSPLPSGYCQFVLNFSVSGYICLLVCFADYVPLTGEIIWYLSFTTWLPSLSRVSIFIGELLLFFETNDRLLISSCKLPIKYSPCYVRSQELFFLETNVQSGGPLKVHRK